jgi:hypothetical protein
MLVQIFLAFFHFLSVVASGFVISYNPATGMRAIRHTELYAVVCLPLWQRIWHVKSLWGVIVLSSSTIALNPGPWCSRFFMVVVIPGRVMVAGGLSSSVCVAGINTPIVLC